MVGGGDGVGFVWWRVGEERILDGLPGNVNLGDFGRLFWPTKGLVRPSMTVIL